MLRFPMIAALLILIAILPTVGQTQPTFSTEAINEELDRIADASNADPAEFIAEVEQHRSEAAQRGFRALEIKAGSLLASLRIRMGNHDEALPLIDHYLPLAREQTETESVLELLSSRSRIRQVRAEFDAALEDARSSLTLARREQHPMFEASSLASLGQIKQKMGQHTEALTHLIDALAAYEELNNQRGQALVLTSIATSYSELGDLEHAIDYYQQALDAVLALDQKFNASIILYNMAVAYAKDERFEDARPYLERSLEISRQIGDDVGVAYSLTQLAQIEDAAGDQAAAVSYYTEALPILKQSGATLNYMQGAMSLAKILAARGDQQQASEWLDAIQTTVEELDQPTHYASFFRTRAFIAEQAGRYEAALDDHKRYVDFLRRSHEQTQEDQLNELRVKFETLQKEKENRLLAQQNELAQLSLEKQARERQLYLLAVVVLAIASLLVALFLIRQWRQRSRFQEMAMRDELTQARNRRAILQIAEYKLKEAETLQHPLLFALVDLDHFKHINDHYGHDVGDEVLKAFAAAARDSLRSHDRFGRIGGEEWLLVMPDTRNSQAEVIFQRLRRGFAQRSIPGLPEPHQVRFSMGCASIEEPYTSLDTLLKRADDNLYRAKDAGRDQVVAQT